MSWGLSDVSGAVIIKPHLHWMSVGVGRALTEEPLHAPRHVSVPERSSSVGVVEVRDHSEHTARSVSHA